MGFQKLNVYNVMLCTQANLKLLSKIEGDIIGGRFGSSLVCLGDIDYDGYGDIAVGAPYEKKSGGAIYIYNGNMEGVSKRYSQRLIGSDYSPLMRGFGISISEPRDINDDKYPDIAVGAYLSEKVVLFKTIPVVTLNVTLTYLQKIKLQNNMTSFMVDIQVYYKGVYVPESLRESATKQSLFDENVNTNPNCDHDLRSVQSWFPLANLNSLLKAKDILHIMPFIYKL